MNRRYHFGAFVVVVGHVFADSSMAFTTTTGSAAFTVTTRPETACSSSSWSPVPQSTSPTTYSKRIARSLMNTHLNLRKANQDDVTPPVAFQIVESEFRGAGIPRLGLRPEEIPTLLFTALRENDFPTVDAGLESLWAFSSDTTRHIFQHNLTDFTESAHQTAKEFPTSFYGNAFYGQSWEMETKLNPVGVVVNDDDGNDNVDNNTNNQQQQYWIATQVMKTISSDGRLRRWQWELRKHRRPPNLNCWYVESIASSDRKGQFEPE